MAYAAIVSLKQTIDHILSHDSYSISRRQQQQIMSMNKNVISLRAFLEDFPEKANNHVEERIRDKANEVENIMGYFMRRTIGCGSRSWISRVKFRFQLNKVAEQIDSIAGEVLDRIKEVRLYNDDGDDDDSPTASSSSRLAPYHKKEAAMVGFDDDLMAIKERLCGESSKLEVIPIVGMGGIGKTTLAKNAYHDPLTMQYFDIRAWVTVSQDYSTQKILSDLLTHMKEFNTERSGQSDEERVYKILKGRKYLIVMDDMWSTKAWDDIKMIFSDDNNGSRVMLTTRLSDLAAYADSSGHLHEMHLMGQDQSWNLLQRKVFKHEDSPPELESIGKEIAQSCKGLPLAIVVIAGLLSTVSKTPAPWLEIAENVNSAIATKDGQFEKILSLSYTRLPHHLRPCFLYMGAFPEDYEIHVSKLIKLWIAEGFIKSSASRSYEEGAEEYLEDLVKRSLVLVSKKKSNGRIKSCSLHDLMRELCIRKAQQDKFLLHIMDREFPRKRVKNQRRVCINRYNLRCLANIYESTTRAIICLSETKSSVRYIENFTFLQVLDVVYAMFVRFGEIVRLPDEVFELHHLRYLAFDYPVTAHSWRMEIPAEISNFQNLQTLIIHPRRTTWGKPCKARLPMEIWRMPQLRHLVCFYFGQLPNPKDRATSALENLQTLSAVTDLVCTESILKLIPNVKKLGIFYSGDEYHQDYQLENLVYLQQLERLKVTISVGFSFHWNKVNPTFPATLKKLTLSGWHLRREDMRIVGSLPNLQVLKLRNSYFGDGGKWETSEEEFRQLKFLLIERSHLKLWIIEGSHFPNLKCLLLHYCVQIREIPCGIGEIPTLELIEVKGDNRSLRESAKRIKEEQQYYGNDAFEVRCL